MLGAAAIISDGLRSRTLAKSQLQGPKLLHPLFDQNKQPPGLSSSSWVAGADIGTTVKCRGALSTVRPERKQLPVRTLYSSPARHDKQACVSGRETSGVSAYVRFCCMRTVVEIWHRCRYRRLGACGCSWIVKWIMAGAEISPSIVPPEYKQLHTRYILIFAGVGRCHGYMAECRGRNRSIHCSNMSTATGPVAAAG